MPPTSKAVRRLPVVGITGGVGSGKSLVASLFVRWGGVRVSGDEIGKQVLDRNVSLRRQLVAAFGTDIMRRGKIQRAVLAERAFATHESIDRLNRLVHPLLLRELGRQIDRAGRSTRYRAVVVDAALLAEWGRPKVRWDYLIGVWSPSAVRRERLLKRGWTDDQIRARMTSQMPWRQRQKLLDCIVKNDGSVAMLKRRARLCWEKVLSYD
jgi:dephospho-CoA kinase